MVGITKSNLICFPSPLPLYLVSIERTKHWWKEVYNLCVDYVHFSCPFDDIYHTIMVILVIIELVGNRKVVNLL